MQEQCRLISLAEYQKLLSDSMAKDEGVEINAELVHKMHILEKKLEIVTKALKLYSDEDNWFGYDAFEIFEDGMPKYKDKDIAKEALQQIEELSK